MKKFSDYSAHIEKTLRDLTFPGNELAGLYEPVSYSLSAGGKRLRPSLALMAADAFGNAAERAERASVGLEIFHNFTLLHDDVMDQSDMRRGRPSVHAQMGCEHRHSFGRHNADTRHTLRLRRR